MLDTISVGVGSTNGDSYNWPKGVSDEHVQVNAVLHSTALILLTRNVLHL